MFDESVLFIITIVGCSVWGANLVLHHQDCLQEDSKAIFQNCSGPARKQFNGNHVRVLQGKMIL
jgi:hypothetical protein